jgi:hypothetical protein
VNPEVFRACLRQRAFDLSVEDNHLLAKERVFCHEFGFVSGKDFLD